ncbi:hypothetical protein ACFLVS_04950 [Chloroflexota bacterium]
MIYKDSVGTMTSNSFINNPPTSVEQMKAAFNIWKFLLIIKVCIQEDAISKSKLPSRIDIHSRTAYFKFDLDSLSNEDFNTHARNSLISGISLCAIAFDKAMDIAFGKKGKDFPTDETDLTSARAIIFQLRNAFAHDPLQPTWEVYKNKKIKYLKTFQVQEIGLRVNLEELNGKVFQPEDVGGDKGLFSLLEYCIKQVTHIQA